MNHFPPKYALKFLRWFCREDYLEEIEGDLVEVFEKRMPRSGFWAKVYFYWLVLRCFRPGFLKSFIKVNYSNTTIMFSNYLKVSWRNLLRQPFFSSLNILGLSIGMAGALIIGLFIHFELSFNRSFAHSERIFRVNIDNKIAGEVNEYAAVSGPLANVMLRDFPHAESITRFRHTNSIFIRSENATHNVKEEQVVGADSAFFSFFGIDLLYGDPHSALSEVNSLVLTKSAAEKHFSIHEAVGQIMILDNDQKYWVRGVIDDFPKSSLFRDYTVLISINSFDDYDSPAWNNWNFPTFIKLNPEATKAQLDDYLATVKERYLIPWAMQFIPGLTIESAQEQERTTGNYMRFESIALTDIHLKSPNISGEFSLNGDIKDVYILSFIGLLLIFLASVNFTNLSTARSLNRIKEVGIRKTLGSHRKSLVHQFLVESGLVSFLSMVLALLLSFLVLPYFNYLSNRSLEIPAGQWQFWAVLLVATLVLSSLSGSYPALFLSRFSPIKALKGQGGQPSNGAHIRSLLVIVQFMVSVFLIASTLVVFQQLSFIRNKDLGFKKEQVVVLNDVQVLGNNALTLKQEIEKLSNVKSVSLSSYLPTPSARSGLTYFPEGHVFEPDKAIIIGQWEVDFDYLRTLGLELVAGRDFDDKLKTDSSAVILNEAAVAMLGKTPQSAIGLRLTQDFKREDKENMEFSTVIGVVKNFHFETLRNSIDGLSLVLGKEANRMMIKLETTDYSKTLEKVEQHWANVADGQPFDYYFMDDSFATTYDAEQRLSKMFIIFTLLSVFIACLGLFGLAAFNVQRRSKEVSIRKILGASVFNISVSLSAGFLRLVLLAILLATPLAWYAMNRWLQDFSYRIDLPLWVFVLSAILAIGISLLTVSYQSLRAAIRNPVHAIRNE